MSQIETRLSQRKMIKRQIDFLLAVCLIHLSTAETTLYNCIKELGDGAHPFDQDDDYVCGYFTSAYGPSTSYCSGRYSFSHAIGIRGDNLQEVESIFPDGTIVEISREEGSSPYVVVEHALKRNDCVFNGGLVETIHIKYIHVDAANSISEDEYFGGSSFVLGNLVHGSDFCPNNPDKLLRHTNLYIELYAGYDDGSKSHPISPTVLFNMGDDNDNLSFSRTDVRYNYYTAKYWYESDVLADEPYFVLDGGFAINITGTKCQTDYNEFKITCEDVQPDTSPPKEFSMKLNERQNTIVSAVGEAAEEAFELLPHFRFSSFSYTHGWKKTLIVPEEAGVSIWWEFASASSCSIQCKLEVYDVGGSRMGNAFHFKGITDGCAGNDWVLSPPPEDVTWAWSYLGTLAGPTGVAEADQHSKFGYSVAFNEDGSRVIVGAPHFESYGGIAQVYDVDEDGSATLVQVAEDGATYDWTGAAVAMSKNGLRVAVSSVNLADEVNVYEEVDGGSGWTQVGQSIDNDEGVGEEAGDSISLSYDGDVLAVGYPRAGEPLRGLVQVYRYVSGSWETKGNAIAGTDAFDQLGSGAGDATGGHSVALSGDGQVLAVGALGSDGEGNDSNNRGEVTVYSFQDDENDWVPMGNIIYGEATGDFTGSSIALSENGNTIAIGSPGNNGIVDGEFENGEVRVFQYDTDAGWVEDDFAGSSEFGDDHEECGSALTLSGSGSRLAVSCPGVDSWSGAVRMYERIGNTWTQLEEFVGDNVGDHFGTALDLSDNGLRLVAGAQEGNYVKFFEWGVSTESLS